MVDVGFSGLPNLFVTFCNIISFRFISLEELESEERKSRLCSNFSSRSVVTLGMGADLEETTLVCTVVGSAGSSSDKDATVTRLPILTLSMVTPIGINQNFLKPQLQQVE